MLLVDPKLSPIDRFTALASRDGLRICDLVGTHTHADHFSATQLARELKVHLVMHANSPESCVDLRANQQMTDPTERILVYCEFGCVSTLATATSRQMGFQGAVALDGGVKAWRQAGNALTAGMES